MRAIAIGDLSKMTGNNVETIRYYERIGLLPEPRRSEGGQRRYGDDDIKRLAFIRRSRELGFAIAEEKNLLGYVDDGDYICAEISALTLDHLAAMRRKLADLRRLERALKEMILKCDGGDVPGCPMLDALSEGTAIRRR